MDKRTKAIDAHIQSITHAMSGDKEAWLANFADDAIVHDPVGVSPHDPTGEGFRGKERIAEFWDIMIGSANLIIAPHKRYACGDNIVAVTMTATNEMGDLKTFIEMMVTYEVNDEGKVTVLKAHWDLDALMKQIGG